MTNGRPLMVGLGEVLWDLLPSGKVLGGAPTNFAYISTVLGNEGVVASRVGNDAAGIDARRTMEALGLNTANVQQDNLHFTGTANVLLDEGGQPKFTIQFPAAWDFLEWTSDWEQLSSKADVICYGSLAWRSLPSAETIERFLQNSSPAAIRICDANLREPFYDIDTLRKSFHYADILKVNDSELARISALLCIAATDEAGIANQLLHLFNLQLLCITRGSNGSTIISEYETVSHSGFQIEVADAIGAGDAFTACVADRYFQGRPLSEISQFANRFAAWVATQVGATPSISPDQLTELATNVAP